MAQSTLSIGTELQSPNIKYKITEILGQGSFGITYKAKGFTVVKGALSEMCIELPTPFAIKEFYMNEINQRDESGSITGMSEGSLSYNYALKFRKEAENLSHMDHSNIVKVIDFIEANNTFYYVMDYIDGQDMNHYLKDHKLSESEALAIIKDVASALIYMHEEQHMLHLDLKPGNIMRRTADGHIFLIDFGLSKHYNDEGQPDTSTTIGLGTEGYAPIEQGKKSKKANEFLPTIDVYALGGTLFKLLTGKTPPAASDVLSDEDILTDEMDEHKISSKVQDAVVEAMSPVANKRTQSVKDFISMLPYGSPSNENVKYCTDNENNSKLQIGKITDLHSLDEETMLDLSEGEKIRILLFGEKGIINQPVNQPVDLGLSVYWCNSNVGASDTNDGGDFFAKNDTFYNSHCVIDKNKHIPTSFEWNELIQECEWTWIEEYNCTGFLIKGPNSRCIFLPAAGKETENGIEEDGFEGCYWSIENNLLNPNIIRNFKFTYPPSINYIGLTYMPEVTRLPIRMVFRKLL